MFAQIHAPHRLVGDDIVRSAAGQYRTLIDDVGAVADAEGFAHIVVCDQHADATLFQKTYDALNLDDCNWIDASERFIQQNEARISGKCTHSNDAIL